MKIPDIDLTPPQFLNSPEATRDFAIYTAKLTDILRDIYANLGTIRIVDTAPASGEISTIGDNKGNVLSEATILNDATQTNRRLYYKDKAGNLRYLDSA